MEYIVGFLALIIGFLILKNYLKKRSEEKRLMKYIGLYGNEFGTMIANNKIGIGMTLEMLKLSWGEARKIDGKVTKDNYFKANYHYGKYNNSDRYKYRITIVNNEVTEMRED